MSNTTSDKTPTPFKFGKNWAKFMPLIDEERVALAIGSLQSRLGMSRLDGLTFLDVGSGSGLFSLAARRMGAQVVSFDSDPDSVACTKWLRETHYPNDHAWSILSGSILDRTFVERLGRYDIVYSWGVLHHTGNMQAALENIADIPEAAQGKLFIAIYNDQGWISGYWKTIKRLYSRGSVVRLLVIALHTPYLYLLRRLIRWASGKTKDERGMSIWRDMIDWLGGYPFETANPEAIFNFFQRRQYTLCQLKTCGGRMGCNEFVFVRAPANHQPR